MGKYTGSPWGQTRGKVGSVVGGTWKGINWTRAHIFPRQPGKIKNYDLSTPITIRGVSYSAMQMNIRRSVFGMLGRIGRMCHDELMIPIWQNLCDKKKWKMTGLNRFMRQNLRLLYNSMIGTDTFSLSNLPNMLKMQVSEGDLEKGYLLSATYIPAGKDAVGLILIPAQVAFVWDKVSYHNGDLNDDAWLAVYKKPLGDDIVSMLPFGELFVKVSGVKRSAGTANLPIPISTASDLTAFLFFSDDCANYSPSISSVVV